VGNIANRMKKYDKKFNGKERLYTDESLAVYADLQAAMQALDVAREALADIAKRGKDPFTSHKWLVHSRDVAEQALITINKLLGEEE
jgi:hypothetical protein